MAIGRISGQLLKSNLERNGADLAFETDLLYLDVANSRIGINSSSPGHALEVLGTVNSTAIQATSGNIANISLSSQTISANSGSLTINGATATDPVTINNVSIVNNTLSLPLADDVLTITNKVAFNTNGAINIPSGTSAERPVQSQIGDIRYNTETGIFEGYRSNNEWQGLGGQMTLINVVRDRVILGNRNGPNQPAQELDVLDVKNDFKFRQIFVQPTEPTVWDIGDVWIKTNA